MKNGIIYAIKFVNNKYYIGQTISGIKRRIDEHIRNSFNKKSAHYNSKVCRAIRKYFKNKLNAKNGLEYSILYDNLPMQRLDASEVEMIAKFDSFNNGYNLTTGGQKEFSHNKESLRKIRKASSGQKPEDSPSRRTNWKEVREIRKAYKKYGRHKAFEKFSHLAQNTILDIIKNRSWVDEDYKYISDKKLNKNKANEIRRKYLTGAYTMDDLAYEYNISRSSVYNILNNKVWIDNRFSVVKTKMVSRLNERSSAKLTPKDVRKIRKLHVQYNSLKLSKMFGVCEAVISNIINNKTWRDV